jgi:lactoylglutathione lyase
MTADGRSVRTTDRPFVILGIQQVALGAADKHRLVHLWVELLGLVPTGTFRSVGENVDEDIVGFVGGRQQCEVDLMQPVDAGARPHVAEPALNHIGLWVDDLPAACRWLSARGVRFAGGIRKGGAGHDVCFIHPKGDAESPVGGAGVLIELVQAPVEVVEALAGGGQRSP